MDYNRSAVMKKELTAGEFTGQVIYRGMRSIHVVDEKMAKCHRNALFGALR
jgi:hypothetical protein